jgi:RimJ/RimL family protein N-acetyltransferase
MSAEPFSPDDLPQPPFETARLRLRPYKLSDAAEVYAALDLHPDVWRFDPGHPTTLVQRRAIIRHYAALHDHFGFGPCGAWLKDGTFVGQGGLNPYIYDERDGTRTAVFEVMYKLARPFWGQGYATEIARFWVDFAFRQVRLPVLKICPVRENVASVAVLQRLGATFEDDWLDETTVIATIMPPPN